MLDLNIGAGFSVDADSVTSTTNNAAFAAADELNSNSSTYKDSIPTLNFAILHGNAIEIEDNMNNNGVANNINELQLFPAADRAKHSLNSSAAEVSRSGGVELGIFKAQMPYNNGVQVQQPQTNRCRRGPRSRSSQYRGITFYRRTRRWESHIWDGHRQIYLGGFDTAHAAARAYDRAAIKFRGVHADINFSISDYEEDMKQMKNLTNKEFVQTLRCKSNGFSRGSSKYRGLTLRRMGQFFQKKPYHDKATIAYNQRETPTNFKLSNYKRERSSTLTDGGSGRNLDLNLGISLASDGPWRNYTTSNLHFPCTSSGSPYGKGVKVQTSSASSQGLIMTSKYVPTGGGIYFGFSPNSKQKSKEMSGEAISAPGISNWERNVQSNVMVNRVPVLCSAPSSGFSFTTTLHSTPSSRPIAIRGTYI